MLCEPFNQVNVFSNVRVVGSRLEGLVLRVALVMPRNWLILRLYPI
jgi:hypothetical protein